QMWGYAYANANLISLALSLFLNGTLAVVVFMRRKAVANYRRFFYVYCVLGVLFSIGQYIAAPFFWSQRGLIVVVAASKDSLNSQWMVVGLFLWFSSFMLISLLVAASFVYRHA
ncbi:hypothetical protein PMAYCL1PPCAC_30325, partial [Pristionchus mayeri]